MDVVKVINLHKMAESIFDFDLPQQKLYKIIPRENDL